MPWRRLPSTSTRVWLGLRPRSFSDRLNASSLPPETWAWIDGMFCASDWTRSGWPTRFKLSEPSTTTGAGLSAALTPVWRVPVTITASAMGMAASVAVVVSAAATTTCPGSAAWAAAPADRAAPMASVEA